MRDLSNSSGRIRVDGVGKLAVAQRMLLNESAVSMALRDRFPDQAI